MSIQKSIFTGYANGDLHVAPIPSGVDPSSAAAKEMSGIGQLTNAGFRTLVASAWYNDEKKTAGVSFAAVWEENETQIILKHGDSVGTSHSFFDRWRAPLSEPMTCQELTAICERLRRK